MIKDKLIDYGSIPQGWSALGIEGNRDVDQRLNLYNIPYDKIERGLDIGSNTGFLTIALAEQGIEMVGVERDRFLVDISLEALEERIKAIDKQIAAGWYNKDIKQYVPSRTFDLILSCQIHMWVDMPFSDYIDMILEWLNPEGYFLFESHDLRTVDTDIDNKIGYLLSKNFKVINEGTYKHQNIYHFPMPKGAYPFIPRKFVLLKND